LSLDSVTRVGRVEKARQSRPTAAADTRGLPPDLLRRVGPRLRFTALIFAGGYFATTAIGTAIWVGLAGNPLTFLPDHGIALLMIALSAGVYFLARPKRLSPAHVVDLGLAFEVVGSLGIGLGTTTQPYSGGTIVQGISWICAWILTYPLLVPAPPRRALWAAFASAVMGPLALAFWVWAGRTPLPPLYIVTEMFFPNFICAGLAYVISRTVHRMGTALERARQMGSYRLVERLNRGGMGEIWRAEHRMLARPAAIKLLRPELFGVHHAIAVRRFEREARATAALSSPHTIELFDYGTTEDGTFYYVMELLDGMDLEALVAEHGPLPPERAVHFLAQACLSLADAHAHGLVHRDVKPGNLFVCRQGLEWDFLKVLDFGLVKPREEPTPDQPRLTADTLMTGTPSYMAPESSLGVDIDGRADLYSLGCVAYWLLTGQTVFEGKTPVETVLMHVRTPPTPPSQRVARHLPAELEALVMACLEKEPAKRPGSAVVLLQRLQALPMATVWTQERAAAWWQEHARAADGAAGERPPATARGSLRVAPADTGR
jgi:serine/threonine-protein kinase